MGLPMAIFGFTRGLSQYSLGCPNRTLGLPMGYPIIFLDVALICIMLSMVCTIDLFRYTCNCHYSLMIDRILSFKKENKKQLMLCFEFFFQRNLNYLIDWNNFNFWIITNT